MRLSEDEETYNAIVNAIKVAVNRQYKTNESWLADAEQMGLPHTTYKAILYGSARYGKSFVNFKVTTLLGICKSLGIKLHELLEEAGI